MRAHVCACRWRDRWRDRWRQASERSTAGESALHLAVAGEHRQACELLLRSTDMQLTGHTARNDSGLSPMETCGATFRTEARNLHTRCATTRTHAHTRARARVHACILELAARPDTRNQFGMHTNKWRSDFRK